MKAYECQLLAVKRDYSCCECQVGVMHQLPYQNCLLIGLLVGLPGTPGVQYILKDHT